MLAFAAPSLDFLAFAPEIVVAGTLVVLLLVDVVGGEQKSSVASTIAGLGLLGATIPIVIMASDGFARGMFGDPATGYAYVVDNFALLLKALFILSGYVVVLISTNYIGEGDYWEAEYYELILASVLGMMVMASARDLITIFVALELLSIPAYMLAAWRKRDLKSDEAGMKYYLMGVFASAIMLYGMSLLYGYTGATKLTAIAPAIAGSEAKPVIALAIVFVLIGFAFKVSAVPFHTWAPDTYEGAPTPVTAFLAVASKAAGFVAILELVFVGFLGRTDIVEPIMWALAVLTMFIGNLIALRQDNMVRMLAYSGVAQAGYMLAPLAVATTVGNEAVQAIVAYLVIYAFMNLGAFAAVIAIARKTRSAEISTYGGLFTYAPGLSAALTLFLASLAGIPPLGGWYAKFGIFDVLISSKTWSGYSLAILVAVNSVIAAFYYMRVVRVMVSDPVPDGDTTPVKIPVSIQAALAMTGVVTLAIGFAPVIVTRFTDVISLSPLFG